MTSSLKNQGIVATSDISEQLLSSSFYIGSHLKTSELAAVGDISDQALAPPPLPFTVGSPVKLIVQPVYRKALGLDTTDFSLRWYVLAIRPKDRGWTTGTGPNFGLGNISLGHSPTDDPELEGLNIPLTDWQKYIKPLTTVTDDALLVFEAEGGDDEEEDEGEVTVTATATATATAIVRSAKTTISDLTDDVLRACEPQLRDKVLILSRPADIPACSAGPQPGETGYVTQIIPSTDTGYFRNTSFEVLIGRTIYCVSVTLDNNGNFFEINDLQIIEYKTADLSDAALGGRFKVGDMVRSVAKTVGHSLVSEDWINQIGQVFEIKPDGTYWVNMSFGMGTFADSDLESYPRETLAAENISSSSQENKQAQNESDVTRDSPSFDPDDTIRVFSDLTDDVLRGPEVFRLRQRVVVLDKTVGDLSIKDAFVGKEGKIIHTVFGKDCNTGNGLAHAEPDEIVYVVKTNDGRASAYFRYSDLELAPSELARTADLTDAVFNQPVVNNVQELMSQFKPGQVWKSTPDHPLDNDLFLTLFDNAFIGYASGPTMTVQNGQWSSKPLSIPDNMHGNTAGISDRRDFPMVLYQMKSKTADLTDDVLRREEWIVIRAPQDQNYRLHINFQTGIYWNDTPGAVATEARPYHMMKPHDGGWLFRHNEDEAWHVMSAPTAAIFAKAWGAYFRYGDEYNGLDTTASVNPNASHNPRVVKYHSEFSGGAYQVIFQVWYPSGDSWFYQVPFDSKEAYELFEVRHKFTPGEKVNTIKDSATMSRKAAVVEADLADLVLNRLKPGDVVEFIADQLAITSCGLGGTRFGVPGNRGNQYTVSVVHPDVSYGFGQRTKYKSSRGEFEVEGTHVEFPLEYWQDFFKIVNKKTAIADLTDDVLTNFMEKVQARIGMVVTVIADAETLDEIGLQPSDVEGKQCVIEGMDEEYEAVVVSVTTPGLDDTNIVLIPLEHISEFLDWDGGWYEFNRTADISEDILNQPDQEPYPGAKVIFIGSDQLLRSVGLSPGMLNDRVLDVQVIEPERLFYYGANTKYFYSQGVIYVGGYLVPLAYWQDFIQLVPFSERRSDLTDSLFSEPVHSI